MTFTKKHKSFFLRLLFLLCFFVAGINSFAQSSHPATDGGKYKVVFANRATMSSFVDELNKGSQEGYRLKAATFGYHVLLGWSYSIPVGILQSDETQFEYDSFQVTGRLSFALSGFESKYAEQSKDGFRLVDYFLSKSVCDVEPSDAVVQTMPICAATYQFLVEREKGSHAPIEFVVAEAKPTFKHNQGGTLGSEILKKWADGFYPDGILNNYQILLAHADKADLPAEPLEIQVVNSTFMNHVKKKIKTLGQQGFRLAMINEECAVMYRRPNEQNPVTYEWLDAKSKKLEKELARLQESGARYRMVNRYQPYSDELVFERALNGSSSRSSEFKVLKLSFQLLDRPLRKGDPLPDPRIDLTPEAKETVKLINDLAREGFVVRDLFRPEFISNNVYIFLERSR